ncbi:hypothetical protein [Cetobacterium sp.]|uniref:hypothetical protein n=1 Tax=Cetobacterium sp. TaxID=2071632 RepID=UPI003F415763
MLKIIIILLVNFSSVVMSSDTIDLYSFIDIASSGIGITTDNIILYHNSPKSDSKVEAIVEIKSFAPGGVILQGTKIEVSLNSSPISDNNLALEGNPKVTIPHKLSAELTEAKETKTITVVNEIKTATTIVEGAGQILKLKATSEVSGNSIVNKPKGEYSNVSTISLKILAD